MVSRKFSRFPLIIIFLLIHHPPFSLPAVLCNLSNTEAHQPPIHEWDSQIAPPVAKSSVKSIQTPKGTVKCSCQTVSDEDSQLSPEESMSVKDGGYGKTIEIEIHEPQDDENSQKKLKASQINSFTLDDEHTRELNNDEFEEDALEDRIFSTEEPPSFLSFLSAIASQVESQPQNHDKNSDLGSTDEEEDFGETEDELASSSSDLHSVVLSQNRHPHHRFEEADAAVASTTESLPHTGYKAFRSSELSASPMNEGAGLSYMKNTKSTLVGNLQDETDRLTDKEEDSEREHNPNSYFLWDFMYSGSGGGNKRVPIMSPNFGKKREFMYLGSVIDPFKGPRRRRRSLRGKHRQASPVFFVYPEGYRVPPSTTTTTTTTTEKVFDTISTSENEVFSKNQNVKVDKIQERSDGVVGVDAGNKEEIRKAMQAAMNRAWEEYGPKGQHAMEPSIPPPPAVVTADLARNPHHPYGRPQQQVQTYIYSPPRPFLYIDRIFNPFQPMSSEWDKRVERYPLQGPPPPPPEPGLFSRFLARYIDFEVNNHEAADIMRRVVFALFVGFLIILWIGLGVLVGVVPLKKWLAYFSGVEASTKRIDKGKEFSTRDAVISDLTDKILLSLDADWLKKLEERVLETDLIGTGGNARKIQTQVFCCILPDARTNGMVECQVRKTPKKGSKPSNAFKCISDLIYNFQFGPKGDGTGEETDRENTVNSKSKANNGRIVNGIANETVTVVFDRLIKIEEEKYVEQENIAWYGYAQRISFFDH